MRLQPIVYTPDMEATIDWYGKVLGVGPGYTSDMWTTFTVAGATLAVHYAAEKRTGSGVELSLIATEPLDDVLQRLKRIGVAIERGIQDEAFGRSLLLRDPNGSPVQINEHRR